MISRVAVKHNYSGSACGELHIPINFTSAAARLTSKLYTHLLVRLKVRNHLWFNQVREGRR